MLRSRLLRNALASGAFALLALASGEARAQFANHSIGFEAGYNYVANPDAQNVASGFSFGISSTLYIENGFDLYFRALLGIHKETLDDTNVVALVPALGVRYLLSEDTIRPYLGLSLGYMHVFMMDYIARFNVTPNAGIEFFVGENLSLGLQAEYHLIVSLNSSPEHGIVGLGRINWYF